jgi:hypothetical protein
VLPPLLEALPRIRRSFYCKVALLGVAALLKALPVAAMPPVLQVRRRKRRGGVHAERGRRERGCRGVPVCPSSASCGKWARMVTRGEESFTA